MIKIEVKGTVNPGGPGGLTVKSTKIVKDVIHQFVKLPGDFVETAVDTPLFQRLRDVKQLGLVYLVYPGATHTRFEHSLGVAHVMATALESLQKNTREHVLPVLGYEEDACKPPSNKGDPDGVLSHKLCNLMVKILDELGRLEGAAVAAALYHDIGHIAMSHSGEQGLTDLLHYFTPAPDIMKSTLLAKNISHERLGIMMLEVADRAGRLNLRYRGRRVDSRDVLDILNYAYTARNGGCGSVKFTGYTGRGTLDKFLENVEGFEVWIGDKRVPEEIAAKAIAKCLIAQLLSSPIDVDRADYTLRDSLHSGSRSGVWDINRYYSVLLVVPRITASISTWEYKVQFHVGVLDKGVSVIESMLLSRVYMYGDVYLHDIGMIYAAVAGRFLALLNTVSRYINYRARSGDEEAQRLEEKYDVVRALVNLDYIENLAGQPTGSSSAYDLMLKVFTTLTDSPLIDLARRIATGNAPDLLGYISTLREEGEEEASRSLPGPWLRKACASMVLAARAILFRRHWKALILSDERAARIIESFKRIPGELGGPEASMLRSTLDPFLIIHWGNYVPYKGEGKSKVYVFRRRNPLRPEELERCKDAKVISKLVGVSYSKILLAVPNSPSSRADDEAQLHGWYWRGGKLSREDLEAASSWCSLRVEALRDMLRDAEYRAVNAATSLVESL